MNFPSKLIEDAVNAFASLPGIGKKSALRLVLHLLQKDVPYTEGISHALLKLRKEIHFCRICHNISDEEICNICSDPHRESNMICVVENFRDVLAIESTNHFRGKYHILDGLISPIDGIGPEKLHIESLMNRVNEGDIEEIIMALNPTMDGDTTIYYLSKRLKDSGVKITTIARGVAFGGELEYVDEVTLARSLSSRLPFDSYFKQ
ncbi:MAG: recombination protein RecR [Bacteroidetes bacterium]|nr:recombination protein RecR [Bacteroidota bacterium]